MIFEKRILSFKKMLFILYVRQDKNTLEDWNEEAEAMALLSGQPNEAKVLIKDLTEYMIEHFTDDPFTDFKGISEKMAGKLYPNLK